MVSPINNTQPATNTSTTTFQKTETTRLLSETPILKFDARDNNHNGIIDHDDFENDEIRNQFESKGLLGKLWTQAIFQLGKLFNLQTQTLQYEEQTEPVGIDTKNRFVEYNADGNVQATEENSTSSDVAIAPYLILRDNYQYDKQDNPTSYDVTKLKYNPITETSALKQAGTINIANRYNESGKLEESREQNGFVIQTLYDSNGNITSKNAVLIDEATDEVTKYIGGENKYQYDSQGRVIGGNYND